MKTNKQRQREYKERMKARGLERRRFYMTVEEYEIIVKTLEALRKETK